MDNKFYPLDCDDDVLLFNQSTFLVGRFKELVQEEWRNKFNWGQNNQTITDIFKALSIGGVYLSSGEIIWNSSSEGIKCQILKVGAKGWEEGKFRTQVSITHIPHPQLSQSEITEIKRLFLYKKRHFPSQKRFQPR
ncbi:hypothetical protein H6F77_24290 [Microcoleus sp. FACHB-831]|uniref:KGK domain-containing protein n=1 Tax=Microcoleus sp. FACHB-831 TaxID=2692827 RepID=UPI001681CE91|nr:KGK domain-containing protein [Microcoleus sp. FACHB-831]MBD1924166.1 hypothetical protein [Microcoleus sp. FACHB-831]